MHAECMPARAPRARRHELVRMHEDQEPGHRGHWFDNITNDGSVVDVEEMYTPVGLAVGSQTNLILATEEMMSQAGYEARRVIPIHEERLNDTFPSRISKEGLRITEICLADGESSKVS